LVYREERTMRRILVLVCGMSISLSMATASEESVGQMYSLDMVVNLALARNPAISFAEGNIEQQKDQQTTAGAYPNPTVTAYGGHGILRDVGRAGVGPFLDRTSLTEYNVVVGQP